MSSTICDELSTAFCSVDREFLETLLDSTQGILTDSIWEALIEAYPIHATSISQNTFSQPCIQVQTGSFLVVLIPDLIAIRLTQVRHQIAHVKHAQVLVKLDNFGIHNLNVQRSNQLPDLDLKIFAYSPTYRLSSALDRFFDVMAWSWTKKWTDDLESIIIQLIIVVDEDLKPTLESMNSMMQNYSLPGGSLKDVLETFQYDFSQSLEKQNPQSIGRLYETVHQLAEMSDMMPLFPKSFTDCVSKFEAILFSLSDKKAILDSLKELEFAFQLYLQHLSHDSYRQQIASLHNRLLSLIPSIEAQIQDNNPEQHHGINADLTTLWKIRPTLSFSELLKGGMQTMLSVNSTTLIDSSRITYYPIISARDINNLIAKRRDIYAPIYAEILTGSVMMLGGLMSYKLGQDVVKDQAIITGLLHAGYTYVESSGSLLALFGNLRVCLDLRSAIKDPKMHARRKDVARILRSHQKKNRDSPLSLKVNTDFNLAVTKLREHHKPCWIGDSLEAAWRAMFEANDLIVFELWYENQLIALDVGHYIRNGTSFYVATRYFDSSYKKLQPGFILAFVEAKTLRDQFGCSLWDLGDYNRSPQMSYKAAVASVYQRPDFYDMYCQISEMHDIMSPEDSAKFTSGILITEITENHLIETVKI